MKYILTLLILLSVNLYSESFILKSRNIQLSIEPQSLEIKSLSYNNQWTTISSKQKKSKIEIIKQTNNQLTWYHKRLQSTFNLEIHADKIKIEIENPNNREIELPKISKDKNLEVLAWPYSDGLWIPINNLNSSQIVKNRELPDPSSNFFGITHNSGTHTYILKSKYKTEVGSNDKDPEISILSNESLIDLLIITSRSTSPIESGLKYKNYLLSEGHISKFIEKELKTDMLGAPIIFLQGKDYITEDDIIAHKLNDFCKKIVLESTIVSSPSFNLKRSIAGMKEWRYIVSASKIKNPSRDQISNVAVSLSKVLSTPNFHSQSLKKNSEYLFNSFSDYLKPIETWGSGESIGYLSKLKDFGIDKSIIFTENPMSQEMRDYAKDINYIPGDNKYFNRDDIIKDGTIDIAYKIPLLNAVYHDITIMPRQIKSSNNKVETLKMGLYMQAPLYSISSNSGTDSNENILENYKIFGQLHKKYGASEMRDFSFLSKSRLIQKVTYRGGLTVIANFTQIECIYKDNKIPPESLLIITPEDTFIF